jgi:hypothetical protein
MRRAGGARENPVVEAISMIRRQLPFALRGVDTYNDGVFMNETLQTAASKPSIGRARAPTARTIRRGLSTRMAPSCGDWRAMAGSAVSTQRRHSAGARQQRSQRAFSMVWRLHGKRLATRPEGGESPPPNTGGGRGWIPCSWPLVEEWCDQYIGRLIRRIRPSSILWLRVSPSHFLHPSRIP